jgi:hypothetical protein
MVLITSGVGCKDAGEQSKNAASQNVTFLADLVEKDIGEIERGLPEGARKAESLLTSDGTLLRDPAGVRKGLQKIQRDVSDLLVAKSTFFALADEKGIAVRNNLEPDVMAGKDLFAVFPTLKTSVESGDKPLVFAVGQFPEAAAAPKPDRTWLAASPVRASGKVVGHYLTGWSYRSFARHLQESLLSDIKAKLMANGETGKLPIVYVAVFDEAGVYTERQTPDVNEKALVELQLTDKTAQAAASGVLKLTDRTFGWAAVRTPKLAPSAGVAVLRSEI